jgi:hypothetical protein
MKKLILISITILFISCDKIDPVICTTCTEATTQTKGDYCGTLADVKVYEQTLYNNSYGQNWTCVRN